jgi:peptide deformylase
MKRQVLIQDDPRLREKAQPVTDFGDKLRSLIEDMRDTLKDEGGIGLAAPQIGEPFQVILVCKDGDPKALPMVFVNPEIVYQLGTQTNIEGCLSIPGQHGEVRRAFKIRVYSTSLNGKKVDFISRGLESACLQHEMDHLNGVLFTDKIIGELILEKEEEATQAPAQDESPE